MRKVTCSVENRKQFASVSISMTDASAIAQSVSKECNQTQNNDIANACICPIIFIKMLITKSGPAQSQPLHTYFV